jgi:hypothetical protein
LQTIRSMQWFCSVVEVEAYRKKGRSEGREMVIVMERGSGGDVGHLSVA